MTEPRKYSEGAKGQLEWMEEMERIEQELFEDAVPRSELIVCFECQRIHRAGPCPTEDTP